MELNTVRKLHAICLNIFMAREGTYGLSICTDCMDRKTCTRAHTVCKELYTVRKLHLISGSIFMAREVYTLCRSVLIARIAKLAYGS